MAAALEKCADAIKAWIDADAGVGSFHAAIGGRVYYAGSVPSHVTWPYLEVSINGHSRELDEDSVNERRRVSFRLFEDADPDGAKVDAIKDKLLARFDDAKPTFTGGEYDTVDMNRVMDIGGRPASPDQAENRSMAVIDYIWWIQQAR